MQPADSPASPASTGAAVPYAGQHGGDGPAVARALGLEPADLLDLSQTMNPFAPDVKVILRRHLDSVGHYPDPREATAMLADVMGVTPERLLLTNGGSEAITMVTEVQGGGARSEPEFALHPRAKDGPRWRSNPHSPSGRLATREDHADVWDEAFYPLATGAWTAGRGGIVVGSLTKTFACPGLRLGYLLAEDVEPFAARQPHWSVSSLALATLPDLLAQADLARWARRIASARDDLATLLRRHGMGVEAADAPWVLARSNRDLRTELAPHGVLVRDCASFGMPGTYRIAVPDAEGLERLSLALQRLD
ncbi:MAG: aminotransferase class I/II-fold pyridoxal phosphate-dependent enzyme [Ornithinimicrobium sp.]